MAETENYHEEKNISHEVLEDFEKNPLTKSSDKDRNEVEMFDPYAEDAKHTKYWRSLQSFQPVRFSR